MSRVFSATRRACASTIARRWLPVFGAPPSTHRCARDDLTPRLPRLELERPCLPACDVLAHFFTLGAEHKERLVRQILQECGAALGLNRTVSAREPHAATCEKALTRIGARREVGTLSFSWRSKTNFTPRR